jgi:hypothetical protein
MLKKNPRAARMARGFFLLKTQIQDNEGLITLTM